MKPLMPHTKQWKWCGCVHCRRNEEIGRGSEKPYVRREIEDQIASRFANACDAGTCDDCAKAVSDV